MESHWHDTPLKRCLSDRDTRLEHPHAGRRGLSAREQGGEAVLRGAIAAHLERRENIGIGSCSAESTRAARFLWTCLARFTEAVQGGPTERPVQLCFVAADERPDRPSRDVLMAPASQARARSSRVSPFQRKAKFLSRVLGRQAQDESQLNDMCSPREGVR